MIPVQKITAPLDLGGYDAAYAGQVIQVWMNLPAALRQKRLDLLRGLAREVAAEIQSAKKERPKTGWFQSAWQRFLAALRMTPPDQMKALMSEVWSAGAEAGTRWTVREVQQLQDADPLLYAWLVRESWRMIDEWQDARKKKL